MEGGAVGGPVVGEELFDFDAVAGKEGECAAEEADRGGGFFVGEDLGVGEAAVVVDCDVDVLPADGAAAFALMVSDGSFAMVDPVAPTSAAAGVEASELLDVDVDQLSRPGALVALRLLESEPAEPPHPRALQDPRDG